MLTLSIESMALSSSTACDYCSIPTDESVNCALDSDLNRVPRGRMDEACAMLLCSPSVESEVPGSNPCRRREKFHLSKNYNKFTVTVPPFFIYKVKYGYL